MSSTISKYWKAWISLGSSSALDYAQQIRLMTLNAICVISVGLVTLFTLIFVAQGSFTSLQGLAIIPVMLLVLYLNATYRYGYARVIFIFFLLFLVLVLALADRRTGTEYVLIALGCLSAFVFESVTSIAIAFISSFICFAFYRWYDATHPFVANPSIPYLLAQNLIMFVSALVVIIQLLVFRSLVNTYSLKLTEANQKTQLANEELQTTNEELKAQTEHLDSLVLQKSAELQAYSDAINVNIYSAVTNFSGTILRVNKPLVEACGYEDNELIGKNFRVLNSGYHPQPFFKNMLETIQSGKSWRGDVRNKRKDGTSFWIEMVIMPIKNESRVITHFLSLALPITERKEAEEQQVKIAKMLESIAFSTSHNVRGPLARMQGLTNLINNKQVHQDELEKVAEHLTSSLNELDVATSELTHFVNAHFGSKG
jgi:PAS domain S-box-containing protein